MLQVTGIGFPESPRVWNLTLPGLPWLACLVSNVTFNSFSCLLEQIQPAPDAIGLPLQAALQVWAMSGALLRNVVAHLLHSSPARVMVDLHFLTSHVHANGRQVYLQEPSTVQGVISNPHFDRRACVQVGLARSNMWHAAGLCRGPASAQQP